jgi:hypothetical protein
MTSIRKIWTGLFLGVAFWGGCAQVVAQASASSSAEALHEMAQLAGVIFTGQVVGVRTQDAMGGTIGGMLGVVEIEFAVEDAVRGVSGGSYTLREWAGLWTGGNEPFVVGQRYLMLLHAPGAGGLSSPVGGMDGAIPIRGGADGVGRVVDLGWVATRVLRPTAYLQTARQGPVGGPINVTARMVGAAADTTANVAAAVVPIERMTALASQSAGYTAVVGMLRGWEKNDQVAR